MDCQRQQHKPEHLSDIDVEVELDPEDLQPSVPLKKVPAGDLFEAARVGDCGRLALLDGGSNVNECDRWDSVALYYTCLAGHADAARMLLEAGAVCAQRTFDATASTVPAHHCCWVRVLKAVMTTE